SPSRRLLKEGPLKLHHKSKGRPEIVIAFLFSDLLLLGRPKHTKYLYRNKRKPGCFQLVAKLALEEARLIILATAENGEAFEIQEVERKGIQIVNTRKSFVLSAPKMEDKKDWVFTI